MATHFIERQGLFTRRHDAIVRVARALDFLFGLLYALFTIRLLLELVGARRGAGFVQFIAALTNPFYAPFRGIVPNNTLDGSHPLAWSLVIAMVAYAVLHALLRALLRLVDRSL